MKQKTVSIIIFSVAVVILLLLFFNFPAKRPWHKDTSMQEGPVFEIVAEGLKVPWEIKFLPDGEMLVTERPGNLVRIGEEKKTIKVEGVESRGEGGLLGLALHPDFEQNQFIYLYFTSGINGMTENKVERYRLNLKENVLEDRKVIVERIPGGLFHNGGRIEFGPDGYLYITTGDVRLPVHSQNVESLAGKILRVDAEGRIVKGNPFNNEVYSYGHRNPQGLAWDDRGNLWATEHGRSGMESGFDELNLIEKGKNYGWDIIQGNEKREGMETPVINSGKSETWAPAGAAFYKGNIFFAGLRGATLYQYNIREKTLTKHFVKQFGRLRAVTLHDSSLYISTSNRDGRGKKRKGDDKIIRVYLQKLLRSDY